MPLLSSPEDGSKKPTLVPSDEAATKERVAALTEWRRSSENRRMFLVRFENRTSSTPSSSGNGAGIDVSLHKRDYFEGDAAQT